MEIFDQILIYALAFLFLILLVLFFYNRKMEISQRKRVASLFDEIKKQKPVRSPNAIVGVFVIFSKVLAKVLPGIFKKITRSMSMATSARIEKQLQLAGYPFLLDAYSWQWLKIVTAFIFFVSISTVSMGNEQWTYMGYALLLGFLGYFYPDFFLNSLLQKRKNKISRELPDAIDFLSLCLAAGMNFQLAVEEYIRRNNTLLADEFSIFVNQIDVGVGRVEAFQYLLERNESPEMRNFLSSVIQSERLGTSLRPVISSQAEDLRDKRKQFVEKMIAQAPVKMLFPMMFFILPAMLVIALSAVLISSSPYKPSYSLVENEFLYVPVTSGVQVWCNRKPMPVYAFERRQSADMEQIVSNHPEGMTTPEQKTYIEEYFRSRNAIRRASFIRIDLPYNKRMRIRLYFRSRDGKTEVKSFWTKAIRFELEGFKNNRMDTLLPRVIFNGRVTQGHEVILTLNKKPLILNWDEEEKDQFTTSLRSLIHGRNHLTVLVKDRFGGALEKSYNIFYRGISVKAQFKEKSPTLAEEVTLIGEAAQGSTLHILKLKGNKTVPVKEVVLEDSTRFSVQVPLDVGPNVFHIFIRRDNDQSPVLQRSMERRMTE